MAVPPNAVAGLAMLLPVVAPMLIGAPVHLLREFSRGRRIQSAKAATDNASRRRAGRAECECGQGGSG